MIASTSGGGEPKSSDPVPGGGGSSGGGEVIVAIGSWELLSRYESQKIRDWNTSLQYLKNHRPPLSLAALHLNGCTYFGHPNPLTPCACPLKQAWGSLDALIGKLRDAYQENGGTTETNPFGSRDVRIYLREVREVQEKARGTNYDHY
ncbi:hypothetical protein MKX03_026080 [Papaver bracteatum]|nr:hypothetical protein MKX03_026080 [Papaver bracteatum]